VGLVLGESGTGFGQGLGCTAAGLTTCMIFKSHTCKCYESLICIIRFSVGI
jgi:hypothetical protein